MSAEINKPGTKGLRHVMDAAGYSMQGLKAALQYEEAFRIELMLVLVLVPLGIWLGGNAVERALLLGSLMLVLIVELLNSALEAVVDRVGVEHHTLSGRAKDIGSAAVFLAVSNVGVIWGLIAYQRFFS